MHHFVRLARRSLMTATVAVSAVVSGTVLIAPWAAEAQTAPRFQQLSDNLIKEAQTALTRESEEGAVVAQTLLERALVANPASVKALIELGKTHELQDRVGRGLKYYRKALEIEPNNLEALEVQALAFLKQDLFDQASENREKLFRLCQKGCDSLNHVEAALEGYRASGLMKNDTDEMGG